MTAVESVGRFVEPEQLGKWLILVGVGISVLGVLTVALARFGLFRLPGDINLRGENWRIYIPLASCILLSVILTLVLWIIRYFKR